MGRVQGSRTARHLAEGGKGKGKDKYRGRGRVRVEPLLRTGNNGEEPKEVILRACRPGVQTIPSAQATARGGRRDLPRADEKDQTPQRDEPGHGMGDPYLLPPSRRRGGGRGDGPELTTDPPGPVQMTEKSGGCGVSCVVP